jgi:hypothetical protein
MVGSQFHPEFASRPDRPHPLFREFIGAAVDTLREGAQHEMPIDELSDASGDESASTSSEIIEQSGISG